MKGTLLAMPVASSPRQRLITLPRDAKLYGPLDIAPDIHGEYAEFIWDGERYKCHVDEFVEGTSAAPGEVGEVPAGASLGFKDSSKGTESKSGGCPDQRRLLDAFGEAVQELLLLHEQQFLAVIAGEPDSHRFDVLIHMANEKKQQAKYAYLAHVEKHCCLAEDATDPG